MSRPTVLLIAGYFDWFSGYQETALAAWFPRYATTEVIASDRVSPIFTPSHLSRLGIPRRYETGTTVENGVAVTRFRTVEKRGMVWSRQVRRYIEAHEYDLIVQVMPGQVMPLAGSLARTHARRAVLYGDNSAMWSHIHPGRRALKAGAFAMSKGMAYRYANQKADAIYGYTPETITRLRPFTPHKNPMRLLPLAFDPDRFFYDQSLRSEERQRLGYGPDAVVYVSAGKFQAKKRLDLLIDAFLWRHEANANSRLLLVGADTTEYAQSVRRAATTHPVLRKSVRIMPFMGQSELNRIFNAADIGVWPSMPAITIQQAMGTGLVVAIPKTPWVSHLIRGETGAYFEPDPRTSGTLGAALVRAEALLTSAREARATANRWFGADATARQLLHDAGISTGDKGKLPLGP